MIKIVLLTTLRSLAIPDSLRTFLRPLLRRPDLTFLLLVSLLVEIVIWVLWKTKIEGPQLPFFVPTLLAPPKFTLLVLVLNAALSLESLRHDKVFAYLLMGTTFFIQALTLLLMFSYLRGGGASLII